jgi:hypothetical protein
MSVVMVTRRGVWSEVVRVKEVRVVLGWRELIWLLMKALSRQARVGCFTQVGLGI